MAKSLGETVAYPQWPEIDNDDGVKIKIGWTYQLTDGRIGTVRYIGHTSFKKGKWIGLELGRAYLPGKHNGMVDGERYFRTQEVKGGIFVRPDKIKARTSAKKGKAGKQASAKAGAIATGTIDYKQEKI